MRNFRKYKKGHLLMSGLEPSVWHLSRSAHLRSHFSCAGTKADSLHLPPEAVVCFALAVTTIAVGKVLTAVGDGSGSRLESNTKRTPYGVLFVLAPDVGLEPTVYKNPESLSRAERGKVTMRDSKLIRLFRKLGIEKCRYNGFVVTDKYEDLELKHHFYF